MNFINPTHSDCVIFNNVINLVYLKQDNLNISTAKLHNIFQIHKDIANFITPPHKTLPPQKEQTTTPTQSKNAQLKRPMTLRGKKQPLTIEQG